MKLFVYGTLKSTESNHSVLDHADAEFIANVTTLNKYTKGETSFFPYITEKYEKEFIDGELYEVKDNKINIIDCFEGAPTLFYRKVIDVYDCNNKQYKAQCYFYKY
jgi:gamma-glutamylcyclotransferase (GGCT)/AIG2-like uncharacterized protein YtfP